MSEIVFASSVPLESRRISRKVKEGGLRAVVPRVYTSNLKDPVEKVVRRNLALILGTLFPNALISHRSALEGGGLQGDDIFLTYSSTRNVAWPGVTIHLLRGPGPLETDRLHLGKLHLASRARALLENMQPSRGKAKKCLPREAAEQILEKICRIHGEAELNRLRDEARDIAKKLGMADEFTTLNHLFSSFLARDGG